MEGKRNLKKGKLKDKIVAIDIIEPNEKGLEPAKGTGRVVRVPNELGRERDAEIGE